MTAIKADTQIETKLQPLKDRLADMNFLLMAVIIVLFVGFATAFITVWGLVLDATRFKTETYQNLVNKVDDQNYKLDTISAGLKKYHILP